MKHIFIINPTAGKINAHEMICAEISRLGADVETQTYLTDAPGSATRFIREYCIKHHEPVRFYACGGDGTLHEVANGVAEFPFAAMGCYPCGSGNDFVKYYGGNQKFQNMKDLINGKECPIDLIRANERYAINAVHFGFDSCVASHMTKLRRTPVIGGKNAYHTSVFLGLIKGMKTECTVEADGKCLNPSGKLLLCTLCNGQYVGGSYRCAPRSYNDDGLIEVCIANTLSHLRFIQIMGYYQKGIHLDDRRFDDVFVYQRARHICVKTMNGFIYAMDGELFEDTQIDIQIMPAAVRFVVPEGATRLQV